MEIITHVRPHLDEVLAVWLIRNFWPGAADATVSFINNSERPADVDQDPARLYVGVGLGRFDEHRGVAGECAAGLVWEALRGRVPLDDLGLAAVDRLVAWVRREDTGRTLREPGREFGVVFGLDGWYLARGKDSRAPLELGAQLLDGLYLMNRGYAQLERDWADRVEFTGRFGRTVALRTDVERADQFAYQRGYDVVIIMNAAGTYRTFHAAADTAVDFTPVREALAARDPGADWFLHFSGKLLILGGDHHANARPSVTSFEDLIELAR
jgi:hypothetical protein